MIPFNKPNMTGKELFYISQTYTHRNFSGDGPFTKKCQALLTAKYGGSPVYLTNSGTAALELAMLALDFEPGDEVIVPSFTFVSCANAVLNAGGTPVFCEIDGDTQNLSIDSVERLISGKTRAVMCVHYAGVSCDMDRLSALCKAKGIHLIEDAAHCFDATYKGKELGTFGTFGCLSFHETKNITCGEGGALIVNDKSFAEKIEIMREKGTDRTKFMQGLADKYTWQMRGSSFLPSDISAAFLYAQLETAEMVTLARRNCWKNYSEMLEKYYVSERIQRPVVPAHNVHNGHIYYILCRSESERGYLIDSLKRVGVQAVFHYVPLHASPYGKTFGHDPAGMENTVKTASTLLRLPMWYGLGERDQEQVCNTLGLILDNC